LSKTRFSLHLLPAEPGDLDGGEQLRAPMAFIDVSYEARVSGSPLA
jgi:hypothetical protein